jgi:hypothetical protein
MIGNPLVTALAQAVVNSLTVEVEYDDDDFPVLVVVACVPCNTEMTFRIGTRQSEVVVTQIHRLIIAHPNKDKHAPWLFAEA